MIKNDSRIRKIHLLKWIERLQEYQTWCFVIPDIEVDSLLIEKVNCHYCKQEYKRALLEEHKFDYSRKVQAQNIKKRLYPRRKN